MFLNLNRCYGCSVCQQSLPENFHVLRWKTQNQNCCLLWRLMVLRFMECYCVQQTRITWHNFSTVSKIKYAVVVHVNGCIIRMHAHTNIEREMKSEQFGMGEFHTKKNTQFSKYIRKYMECRAKTVIETSWPLGTYMLMHSIILMHT